MMNRFEDEFKNAGNIEILSIYSSDIDKKESIERFVNKLNSKSTILYAASNVGKSYNVKGYPKFFIISPEGEVIRYFRGYSLNVEKDIIDTLSKLIE
jgi:thioredoxin-related protein